MDCDEFLSASIKAQQRYQAEESRRKAEGTTALFRKLFPDCNPDCMKFVGAKVIFPNGLELRADIDKGCFYYFARTLSLYPWEINDTVDLGHAALHWEVILFERGEIAKERAQERMKHSTWLDKVKRFLGSF